MPNEKKAVEAAPVVAKPRTSSSKNFTYQEVRRMAKSLGIAPIGKKADLLAKIDAQRAVTQKQRVSEVREGVGRVGDILIQRPQAMTVVLKRDDTGRSFYVFADSSVEAQEARDDIREILTELWQTGAYNFDMIARQLRVNAIDVQAMLDDGFADKHRLV